jgi:hypothetical protein
MPSAGFEGAKALYALDRSATVFGKGKSHPCNMPWRPIGLWDVEAPHFLDTRLTDGGKFVSLTGRQPLTIHEDSLHSFLLEAESISGPQCAAAGRIKSIEKSSDLIGNGTRDLPACSVMGQPTTLPRVPESIIPLNLLNWSLKLNYFT